jgi:UDP-N-acetylmuramoyl-tripeptide--D-alanyl-D-alanine ligase
MLIGYMHYRKQPFGLGRAYAFAAVAKAEGAQLLYFSPGAVDGNYIGGYVYDNGQWVKTRSRYPDVIYNTAGFSREKQLAAADKLQREIPFTSYSIGDKMTVFRNLVKYKKFADYVLPSEEIKSAEHFFFLLDKYSQIVFKPSSGHQGIDVYHIRRKGGLFAVLEGTQEKTLTAGEIAKFVMDKTKQNEYIVQPYIDCRTKSGESYDFRLHVQKGKAGQWVPPAIFPRISQKGAIVCNISRGGHTCDIDEFLEREFGAEAISIKKCLEIFSMQLAAHLDEIQKELYNEELDELGIDVGMDKNKGIYIYEVNWRPGHPPFIKVDLSVIKNTVHYAMFLAERRRAQT